jgi:hypothetical protein
MDSRTLQEVQSETIAIEAVLIALFRRIARADPRMAELLHHAFDEAETVMAGLALKHGMEEVLQTTTAAMTIVEELRQAVIPHRVAAD